MNRLIIGTTVTCILTLSCGGSQTDTQGPATNASQRADEPCAGKAGDALPCIEPPRGWLRRPVGRAVVVSASASPAVIVLTTVPLAATMDRIQQEVNALAEIADLSAPPTIRLKALAQRSERFGPRKLALWELSDAERSGQPGALLVFAGKLTDDDLLVGIGFAIRDDLATSDTILEALATIEPPS